MSQPEPRAENGRPRWTFVSVAPLVMGLLILVPTGLCAALVVILAVIEGDPSAIGFIPMFAGLPALVGGALIYTALKARQPG